MFKTKYRIKRAGLVIEPDSDVQLLGFTKPTMLKPAMARIRHGHDVLEVLPDAIA
jgi:hypothetical protein